MFFLYAETSGGVGRRQPARRAGLGIALLVLAGCQNSPAHLPVDWWHDLQGGEIAADRPPPPGADQPYPTMGPIPPKPDLPPSGTRSALLDQLAMERDQAQRLAARNPIAVVPPPPPPAPAPEKPASPDDQTANASLPAAEAPPPPRPKPAPAPAMPTGPVEIAGSGADETGLPPIPSAPPAPATFEGIPAEPAPTPKPPAPSRLPQTMRGASVLFASGQAVLALSQMPTLKDVAAHRKTHAIEITGYGEAASDTPAAQEAAIDLGLARAQAIAAALVAKQHVPSEALRLSAAAFGRDADVRIVP
jgi:outer membrane protein OmpA-like peptidoglycan-associated protein